MNLLKSVIARLQTSIASDFENSRYGKNLKKFKNTHNGECCFLIGNGPSLNGADLTKLKQNNIFTFAANRVFNIFSDTDWKPDVYVCEDEFILAEIYDSLGKYILGEVFVPIFAKWYKNIKVEGANYYLQHFNKDERLATGRPDFFSDNIADHICARSSVLLTCAQIAMYMGFDELYLIGVDHSYSHMFDKDGNLIVDESVKDHFGNQKNGTSETKGIFNVDATTRGFMDLKEYADLHNVKVFNATRGGKLEVFPRVDFDSLFDYSPAVICQEIKD